MGQRGREPERTVEEVKELVAPYFRRGTEDDDIPTYEERCAGMAEADIVPPMQLTEEQVLASLVSLPRGRSPGQSGWTNSLLKAIGLSEQRPAELVPLLHRWFNRALRGLGGPAELWTLGRAALLPKVDGGTRVLSIGETLFRFFLRTVAFAFKDKGAIILGPHQYSVGVRGGSEQIALFFELAARGIGPGSGIGMVPLDVVNAFLEARRRAVADAVWEKAPELYPLFAWLYGAPSILVLKNGEVVATIETGLRMGCPLAVLFFCLVLAPILESVAAAEPEATIMYYADDGNIIGECEAVKRATVLLVDGMLKVGLRCHREKSVYYDGGPVLEGGATELIGHLDSGEALHLKRVEGAKIVGRAIGSNAFVQASLSKTLNKHRRGLEHIHQLQPDVALLLLTYCVNARPMFLARNFPPADVGAHLRAFDDEVDTCLASILQMPAAGFATAPWIPRLRGLPITYGGIALTRLANINGAAHTACLLEALVSLKARYPAKVQQLQPALTPEELDTVSHYLPFLVEDGIVRLPGEPSNGVAMRGDVDYGAVFATEMPQVRQGALSRKLAQQEHKELHRDLLEAQELQRAALVLSTNVERQMGRWISGGLFLNMHNRLWPLDFLQCLRLRLLVPEYGLQPGWRCGCRERVCVKDDFYHLLNCNSAALQIQLRHDKARDVLAGFCRKCVGDAGVVTTEVEFPGRGELRACRMDIVVSTGMGETSLVDLAVVNTAAQSKVIGRQHELLAANRRGAAFVQGYAAADREEWKRREAAKALDATQTANFKPFVMELSGRLGEGARAFIGQMERCHNARLGDIEGPIAFRKLRAHFFLEMGMVLARGTAKILELARGRTSRRGVVGGAGPPAAGVEANALGVDYGGDEPVDNSAVGAGEPLLPLGNEAIDGNEAEHLNDNLPNSVALDIGQGRGPLAD